MFKKRTKDALVHQPSRRRPLTDADVEGFVAATSQQKAGTPSVYELAELAERLKRAYPIEARSALNSLKWLCRQAQSNGINWGNPWD